MRAPAHLAAGAALAMIVAACGKAHQAAAPTAPASLAPPAASAAAPAAARASLLHGPDMLTAAGEAGDLKEVASAHGVFRVASVDGVDTLPWTASP